MSKLLGATILFTVFAFLFCLTANQNGVLSALKLWGLSLLLTYLVAFGVFLMGGE